MTDSRLTCGQKVAGKYTLEWALGTGGMADVWLAKNDATGAEVALKVARGCDRGTLDADELRERFRNEARACAKLGHRNIVRVFDLIEEEPTGTLILVMERLHGCTLSSCVEASGKIDPTAAVAIVCAVLMGVGHAHRAGLIHRDIKPDNIFLSVDPDGLVTPKVLDFGVAKFPRAGEDLTMDGRVLGTPQYMSPEQIRAKKLDARSDIFSVGTLLYEMLSGKSPFEADSISAALAAVLELTPAPLTDIPPALWEVLSRMLDKDADKRPASAVTLISDLKGALGLSDAALDAALVDLVPPELPDSRGTLDSIRVVLRPAGSVESAPRELESQETLGDVASQPEPVILPPRRLANWVYYTTIAPIALLVALSVVLLGTRASSHERNGTALIATPMTSALSAASEVVAPPLERRDAATHGRGAQPNREAPATGPVGAWAQSPPLVTSTAAGSSSGAESSRPRSRTEVALTPGF